MIQLTSVQEAAFNAAGEAMAELVAADKDLRINLCAPSPYEVPEKAYSAFITNKYHGRDIPFGKGPDGASAVADLLRKIDEIMSAPPQLHTAKEAVDAVKRVAKASCGVGGDIAYSDLIATLDALPVA